MRDGSASRVAILSYHSREITPEMLTEDVLNLRKQGWIDISLDDSIDFIAGGRKRGGKLFHVTSDDGDTQDEDFEEALRSIGCPGTFFINVGTIETERVGFYANLIRNGNFTVGDHGRWHRKHFVSGHVTGYAIGASRPTPLKHLELQEGSPICFSASEIATQRFTPLPKIRELLEDMTKNVRPSEMGGETWSQYFERESTMRDLGYRKFGKFYIRGVYETRIEFEQRIRTCLKDGSEAFREAVGAMPRYYAYAWWEGSKLSDRILKELGYRASFAGVNYVQQSDGRVFNIPRVYVNRDTKRPLSLDTVPTRRLFHNAWFNSFTSSINRLGKTSLGMRR